MTLFLLKNLYKCSIMLKIMKYENIDYFISEFNRILKEKQAASTQEKPETSSEDSEMT